jgi:rubrerythrin
MQITQREAALLNFYRVSELHGGLVLGQLARRVRDSELIVKLTRHSAEEVGHALLWSETIIAVGGQLAPEKDSYQARYAASLGTPGSPLEILALTQVFERRVYRHFVEHARRPGTHPLVRAALRRMLEEERGHLSWVREWLDSQSRTRGHEVAALLRQYAELDARVYEELTRDLGWREAA